MIKRFFKPIILGLIFTAGAGSILATSPPEPGVYFEETNIRPYMRCPGADVVFDWKLNEPGPVLVTVDGREFQVDANTNTLTVAADIFDRAEPTVEAALGIGVNRAAGTDRYEIRTLRKESWEDVQAYHTEDARFAINLGQWDSHIEMLGLQIFDARHLVCTSEAKAPRIWEITAPSGRTLEIHADKSFEIQFDPIPAGGTWRFRPKGAECQPARSGLRPYLNVRLTAVCS